MRTDKHLLIAMVMAPLLALIAYFGINFMLGETPQAAEAGSSYLLVEKPNCRYASGRCGLKNADFELEFDFEHGTDGRLLLKLSSENPLEGVMLAMVEGGDDEEQPEPMRPVGIDGMSWVIEVASPDPEHHRLHLVASANQALYFGDVAMKFTLDPSENSL